MHTTVWLTLFLTLACRVSSESAPLLRKFSFNAKSEKNWWSWAWGAESTVSVVDRSPVVSFASRPAAFGEPISSPILGYVIPLSAFTEPCSEDTSLIEPAPNFACPKLCVLPPYEPDPSEPWIALVQRGKCEFVSKVREAQRLGARAVVVGGDNPLKSGLPDTLINMYSPEDSSDVKIAATFITYADYLDLSTLIATSNTSHSGLRTVSLLITADYSAWEWYSPIITFIIILLLPSFLTFLTLLIHRMRAARAAQRDRAPEDVVRNLPWCIWTGTGITVDGWEKHEGGEGSAEPSNTNTFDDVDLERGVVHDGDEGHEANETTRLLDSAEEPEGDASTSAQPLQKPWFETQLECAICLSDFVKGDKVRVLPCRHIFHMDEVDEWLIQRKKLCPVCKADVTQSHFAGPKPHPPSDEEASHLPTSSPAGSPPLDEDYASTTPAETTTTTATTSSSYTTTNFASEPQTPSLSPSPPRASSPRPEEATNERTPLLRSRELSPSYGGGEPL